MKILICGLWHVHSEGYYKTAAQLGEVVGVYEPNEIWRNDFCAKYALPGYATLEEAALCGAEAAIVCVSTDTHTDAICRLANAGMHIFTEKVLALTSAECEKIESAIAENGVNFVISCPHKYGAGAQTVKKIADSGVLGKINYYRCRNAQNGSTGHWLPRHFYDAKKCGGGAMIDLGAHGMYLSEWLCGMPVSAKSVFTVACDHEEAKALNTDNVEDNAVTVMQYANGCIGINETGFDTVGYPFTLEVAGENGRVFFAGDKVELWTSETKETVTVTMEPALPSPLEQFCTGNILPGCGIREAMNLTKLMEMAYAGK